jgi:flagellum-specific ATP synthase
LIRIGAYTAGNDKELDEAISKKEKMEKFISQGSHFISEYDESVQFLVSLMNE